MEGGRDMEGGREAGETVNLLKPVVYFSYQIFRHASLVLMHHAVIFRAFENI